MQKRPKFSGRWSLMDLVARVRYYFPNCLLEIIKPVLVWWTIMCVFPSEMMSIACHVCHVACAAYEHRNCQPVIRIYMNILSRLCSVKLSNLNEAQRWKQLFLNEEGNRSCSCLHTTTLHASTVTPMFEYTVFLKPRKKMEK